jgi:hypothetical protein
MDAEMVWSSSQSGSVTRNTRKVKTYGEGSYGVEEPITLPSTIPEEINLELPPVKGGSEATQARARLEIHIEAEQPQEKTIEAYYLRESPGSGKKTKLRVRIKKLNEAVSGKPYFTGVLRLSIERYDGRRIEFSFNLRSKPRGLDYVWSLLPEESATRTEETSEGKPIYEIAKLKISNPGASALVIRFPAVPDYLAGYRVEHVVADLRSCPAGASTKNAFEYWPVVEKIAIVPDSAQASSRALSVLERGFETQNQDTLAAGEEKIYSIFGVDRKNNPDTKMELETVAGGCESYCVRMTCEPTPGPRGRDNCVCDEKSWRRTPVRLLLGSRIANEVIFRSHPDARFQNSVSYDGDTGEDQVLWDSIAGSEIRL